MCTCSLRFRRIEARHPPMMAIHNIVRKVKYNTYHKQLAVPKLASQ